MERLLNRMELWNPATLFGVGVVASVAIGTGLTAGFCYYAGGTLVLETMTAGIVTALMVAVVPCYFLVRLVERLREQRDRVETLAATDDLTGVLNRRMYEITVRQEMARSRRYHQPLSLIMVDVDHFKNINDTLGHTRGDVVLRVISDAIAENLRQSDYLFRYGGEEFVVLSPQTDREGIRILAGRIKSRVEKLRVPGVPSLTVSLGLVSSSEDMDCGAMLDKADEALYVAKARGRNRIEFAH